MVVVVGYGNVVGRRGRGGIGGWVVVAAAAAAAAKSGARCWFGLGLVWFGSLVRSEFVRRRFLSGSDHLAQASTEATFGHVEVILGRRRKLVVFIPTPVLACRGVYSGGGVSCRIGYGVALDRLWLCAYGTKRLPWPRQTYRRGSWDPHPRLCRRNPPLLRSERGQRGECATAGRPRKIRQGPARAARGAPCKIGWLKIAN